MKSIDNLFNKFFLNINTRKTKETLKELNINILCETLSLLSQNDIQALEECINKRDKLFLDIYTGEYLISSYTLNDDMNTFIDRINNSIEDPDDTDYRIDIKIVKECDLSNNISIYCFDSLIQYLEQLSLEGLLYEINSCLNDSNFIIFRFQEKNISFYSDMFYFLNEGEKIEVKNIFKNEFIEKRNEICSYLDVTNNNFIPENFYLIKKSNDKTINMVFNKLCIIFSLIFISNLSSKQGNNSINFKINGYKWKNIIINYKSVDAENMILYYDIYKWIYIDGNLDDKIGIARNIISLHLNQSETGVIEPNTLKSIISNYTIYLKKNVEKYIEIKNKITESIMDLTIKTDEVIKGFINTFSKNLIGFLTFFSTVLVMSSITNGKLVNIFNKDITVISFCSLAVSFAFLLISIYGIKNDKKRFEKYYERIKDNYRDILDENDINNILKNDKYLKEDIKFIDDQIKTYSIAWIAILVIIGVGVFILG